MFWTTLYIISLISNLFPLIGAIYYYKKLDSLQFYLFFYAIGIVIGQICDSYIVRVLHRDSVGFFEIYLISQLVFSIWFFNKWRKMSSPYLFISIFFVFAILVFEYLQYFVYKESYKNVSYTFPLLFVFFIIQSMIVILKTFDISDTEFNKSYVFWIAFSNFFYFMMILPFNIYQFFGTELNGDNLLLFRKIDVFVNYLANITLNSLIFYSFTCRKS